MIYMICGWGIMAVLPGLTIVKITGFTTIRNFTFWAETFALIFFAVAG